LEDPDNPAGRFNLKPAIAVVVHEKDWDRYGSAEEALSSQVGDWILDEEPILGKPRTVDGSLGRGAEAWVPVVEWLVNAAGGGIVDLSIAGAVTAVIRRLRRHRAEQPEEERRSFLISRGVAIAVAADDVRTEFGDEGQLEVEAVEEPSTIGGGEPSEISYVGVEPWIVLLRNVEVEARYIVVVAPDGDVMNRMKTSLLPWEKEFLRPGEFQAS